MLAYMHAQNTFFHQGFDLFDGLSPYMKDVAAQVSKHLLGSVYNTGNIHT